ncbi:MAG TPA: hypothetical protein PLL88_03625 [Anaerolineaceae bacterium]|jgi:hypothetical protein|nr:hypothetical protein [Anaerolineaceae bacterium]
MQVITKKNKYFIGVALCVIAAFSFINGDYYSAVALLFVCVSALTTIDKNDASVKNPQVWQGINLAGYVLAAAIWIYSFYMKK